jgi:hypothetical protein
LEDLKDVYRVHRAVFTKINIVLSFLLATIFMSCGLVDKVEEIDPEKITYKSVAVESVTNVNGALDIETTLPDNESLVFYSLELTDKVGDPLEGLSVVYNQVNGKSVIFIKDKLKRYNSAFLYGTPQELLEVFPGNSQIEPEQSGSVDILEILISFPLELRQEAEVPGIPGAYFIQKFHLTETAQEGYDYQINCEDIEQIPEVIKEEISLLINTSSVLISIVSPDMQELIEVSSDRILNEGLNFNENLISEAKAQWGMRKDEVIDKLIAIKSFFPLQSDHLQHVKTHFDYYKIELDNTRCQKYIVDVPEEVNEFLNMDFIEKLEGKGLQVNIGLTPPNVTGNYYVDNWTNLESGTRYVNYSFQFVNQTAAFQIEVRTAAEFSDAVGVVAYISGEGQQFSIYSEQAHNINDGGHNVFIKTADVYSGKISQGGILDFQNGFIVLEKENDIRDIFLNVGDSRVVYEADFIADAVDAFPNNSINLDPHNSFHRIASEVN